MCVCVCVCACVSFSLSQSCRGATRRWRWCRWTSWGTPRPSGPRCRGCSRIPSCHRRRSPSRPPPLGRSPTRCRRACYRWAPRRRPDCPPCSPSAPPPSACRLARSESAAEEEDDEAEEVQERRIRLLVAGAGEE